jgi:outer membrane lipoprotein-sorting protein
MNTTSRRLEKSKRLTARVLILGAVHLGLLLTIELTIPQRAAAQSTDEIVSKALAAKGGVEKAKAIQSERITGTIYFNPELYGPFIAEFKRPGKMHNEVTVQNKTVVRTFNGKDSGWIINPFVGKNSPEPMTADDIKDAVNESDFDGPLVDSKNKGNKIELAGTEKVDGKEAYILKVTHKDGTVSSYSFDAKTYLLAKWSGTEESSGQTITRETFFHDYREVGGMKFAFELVSDNPGADITQRILVEKIELDPEIDDSHFGKPSAPAPSATAPAARPSSTPTGRSPAPTTAEPNAASVSRGRH